MDEATRRLYETGAAGWVRERRPVYVESGALKKFAERLPAAARVADLGCGPGWYAQELAHQGARPLAVDFSLAMLREARELSGVDRVAADLARLPFARESLDAALALHSYSHLPLTELPMALAHLHQSLVDDAPIELTLAPISGLPEPFCSRPEDELEWRGDRLLPGRLFSCFRPERARGLLEAAGFLISDLEQSRNWLTLKGVRAHTLPDYVRPGLRVLFIGLNPSPFAAQSGIPFGRPGNRFWPALQGAGLFGGSDPFQALDAGFGFSDLVKRTTRAADELSQPEYQSGLQRTQSLVARYRPERVVFVGLAGWRCAVDPKAVPGRIEGGIAGKPLYLMPSTSGLNASTQLDGFVSHLRRALEI